MIRQFTTLSLLALVAGCAIQQAEQKPKLAFDSSRNPEWLAPDLYPNGAAAEKEPVVRYGRYTLVSTQPDAGQRDLMAQIIDVTIPGSMNPSVRDAMLYVVDRSGYALCPPSSNHVNILYTRPLPAAQYKLGPMTLRNTLQVLAGPAWQVKVDEVNRQVCFALRPGYQLPEPSTPARQLYASNTSATTPAASLAATKTESVIVAAVPTAPAITTSTPVASTTATASQVLPPVAPPAKDGSTPAVTAASPAAKPAAPLAPAAVATAEAQKPIAAATPVAVTTPSPKPATPVQLATPIAKATPLPAPAPRPLPQVWTAETGSTLRQSVEAWAKKASPTWTVIWSQEDLDYPIEARLRFEGSFQDAIKELFPLYDTAPRSFVVDGSDTQRVLHVDERKKK
ncbi:TcpQ domain-containing protein [Pseudomonas guariconensis]|uniref:PFGI-1 class ICE element type IV pilus protein PilL2 n=1 Tax=Pseudomonas guariconensis TaxID=1288410 RepID=UPI00209AB8F2|nr:TcpQ domain-containing protein [Pseudomonas guariconensis]MCO7620120.1 TcpQ domain-containing protein [Pseudomonas guariconensis]